MSSAPSYPNALSKRHSLNIYPTPTASTSTAGPRPLQLVNGVTIPSPTPFLYSATTTPNKSNFPQPHNFPQQRTPRTPVSAKNSRRHSSISYKRSSYEENDAALVHSTRTQPRPRSVVYPSTPDGRSLGLGSNLGDMNRSPLKLAEKHADLLRFIAQKESKCLELRTQLAVHEEELLQLKSKWERIVSRSFQTPLSPAGTSSMTTQPSISPLSPSSSQTVFNSPLLVNNPSGMVADLTMSNDHHAHHVPQLTSPISSSQTPIPPSPNSLRPQPRLRLEKPKLKPVKPRPHSLYSQYPSNSPFFSAHIRSSNLSTSSNATSTTTTSTTMTETTKTGSASPWTPSAASFDSASLSFYEDEDTMRRQHPVNAAEKDIAVEVQDEGNNSISSSNSLDSCSSELIVRDTGATPTVSPNPKFRFGVGRRKGKKTTKSMDSRAEMAVDAVVEIKADENSGVGEGLGSSSAVSRSNNNSWCHRRKSMPPPSLEDVALLSPGLDYRASSSSDTTSPGTKSGLGRPSTPSPHSSTSTSKRNSFAGVFPPASPATMLFAGGSPANSSSSPTRHSFSSEQGSTATHSRSSSQSQTQSHPPSSWMGKKWDAAFGFQRSTISKSQKRASLLLSDVSQALAGAFSLSGVVGTSSLREGTMSVDLVAPPSGARAKLRSTSLIDMDDGDDLSATGTAPMKPTPVMSVNRGMRTMTEPEEDGEWNW